MAKFSRTLKLPPSQRQELVLAFCQAIQSLKSEEEVVKFLTVPKKIITQRGKFRRKV